MKYTASLAAFLSLALISGDCFGQPPGRGKGKPDQDNPGAGQRRDGARGPGQGRGRPGQGQGRPQGDRDPAQFVARMLEQFDKDGDKKLDLRELTALFTAMRERRGNGGQPGAGGPGRPGDGRPGDGRPGAGRPGDGPGRGQKGNGQRRRPDADDAGDAGGAKPKRPPAE